MLENVAETRELYAFSFLFLTTTSNDSSRSLALTRTGAELQHKGSDCCPLHPRDSFVYITDTDLDTNNNVESRLINQAVVITLFPRLDGTLGELFILYTGLLAVLLFLNI